MSVRAARFNDYWRKIFSRQYSCQYQSLSYSGLKPIFDAEIKFSPGITAIVGGNGVGKSTLIHAIADVLAGGAGVPFLRSIGGRLDGCSLKASLKIDGVGVDLVEPTLTVAGNERHADTRDHSASYDWLDSSAMATLCQSQILQDYAFDDILEGVAPRTLSQEELDFASYLVGKEYSQCIVWEIEEYGPFETWPYFEVICGGVKYDSKGMGHGELSLLTTLWAINRATDNSILLIDEPETHISARSQDALMDTLAWACVKKGLWVVLTTHSPVVLKKLPPNHVRLLVNNGDRSVLIPMPKSHLVASVVGGGTALKSLLLVEDQCALYFVQYLLEELEPDIGRQCAYAVMGGEGAISKLIELMPFVVNWNNIIGCFDGDAREKPLGRNSNWPIVYLPGTSAPEFLLRECVKLNPVKELADYLHMDEQTVTVTLAGAAGIDHHDWLSSVVHDLGRTMGEVVRAMVRLWLRSEKNAAETFIGEIKKAMG